MRKYFIGALACGLALALTLTGCGGNASSGEGAAPNEGTSQGQEQEPEVQEEPSFNAEDFFGCWEYAEGYGWLYIYGDGTYEWFYDDGTSDEGSYEIDDDGVLSIDGSDLVFAIGEDGVMVDSDGDELFQSELPDFDYTPTPEEGGGDHDSGRDYEAFAGYRKAMETPSSALASTTGARTPRWARSTSPPRSSARRSWRCTSTPWATSCLTRARTPRPTSSRSCRAAERRGTKRRDKTKQGNDRARKRD